MILRIQTLLIGACLGALCACATVNGVGQDLSSAGNTISKTAKKASR